jgi:hypothetical protein
MNKLKAAKPYLIIVALTIAGYLTGYDNGQEQKVVEIQNKIQEIDMEWYHYQDVENIVASKTINGYD